VKSVLLANRKIELGVGEKEVMMDREFNHAASKFNLSMMAVAVLLNKVGNAYGKYEKARKGFLNKIWSSFVDSNPLKDIEVQSEIYQKLYDFDQNLRSLELAYLDNLKKVKQFVLILRYFICVRNTIRSKRSVLKRRASIY
jgi:hypothetical protein